MMMMTRQKKVAVARIWRDDDEDEREDEREDARDDGDNEDQSESQTEEEEVEEKVVIKRDSHSIANVDSKLTGKQS